MPTHTFIYTQVVKLSNTFIYTQVVKLSNLRLCMGCERKPKLVKNGNMSHFVHEDPS